MIRTDGLVVHHQEMTVVLKDFAVIPDASCPKVPISTWIIARDLRIASIDEVVPANTGIRRHVSLKLLYPMTTSVIIKVNY
jgi:hypothetical protein